MEFNSVFKGLNKVYVVQVKEQRFGLLLSQRATEIMLAV